jgi:hypothetical protein
VQPTTSATALTNSYAGKRATGGRAMPRSCATSTTPTAKSSRPLRHRAQRRNGRTQSTASRRRPPKQCRSTSTHTLSRTDTRSNRLDNKTPPWPHATPFNLWVGRARLTTPRSNSTWALLRRTFSLGLEFIETNLDADNWFVQIETFDPHEPFFSQEEFKDLYPHDWDGPEFDWPPYREIQPELNAPVIFLD